MKATKRRKMDSGELMKSEVQRYISNQHSGHLQPLELVQNASCAKCSGKTYRNAEVQVGKFGY